MRFCTNQLFHIYNQGNNRRKIFFEEENYEYFLWKMRAYLLPFGDFVAYSLMPNHYHWLFYVRQIEIRRELYWEHIDKIEFQRRLKKYGNKAQPVEHFYMRTADKNSLVQLNLAVGDLQMSYTKAINKSRNMSGSLIRKKFQSKDGWIDEFITLKRRDGKTDFRFLQGNDYGYQCLIYIHANAKKAGLVVRDEDWKYSSARDYAGLRKGTLCNLALGHEILNFI